MKQFNFTSRFSALLLLFVVIGSFSSTPLRACGPWIFNSSDIDMYRIMPYWQEHDYTAQRSDFVTANCRLWAERMGGGVTEQDVRAALYQSDCREWKELMANHAFSMQLDHQTKILQAARAYFGIAPVLSGNAMVRRLIEIDDTDAMAYIALCKTYEEARRVQLSPWYYTGEKATMDSIVQVCLANKCSRYADRYLLLATKALCALRKDAECVRLWNQSASRMPQGLIRDEIEGYVAGSRLRLGQRKAAFETFVRLGDIPSLIYATGNAERVCEILLEKDPANPYFRPTLQKFLYSMEHIDGFLRYQQYEIFLDSAGTDRLLRLCQRAMVDSRLTDKAMWCYTAAAIHDHDNRPQQALRCLQDAEVGCHDSFLCNSIRLFRCYLHARLDPIDDRYEQYLLGELRWIDHELLNEYHGLDEKSRYVLQHIDNVKYSSLRKLYAYDAMRKILLASDGACARLAQHGRSVRALQLANMAENRLFAITHNEVMPLVRTRLGKFQYIYSQDNNYNIYIETNPDSLINAVYVDTCNYNAHDYSNYVFWIADTLTAAGLVEFYERTAGKPLDEFDRFLADKGYNDTNYWFEMIGTHFLREGDYYNAVKYLSEVSADFVHNQNIYFDWNPFSYDLHPLHCQWHPKLVYAENMLWLERQLRQQHDPDRQGLLMLAFSIGMRNVADRCWSYISYGKSDDFLDEMINEYSSWFDPDWQLYYSVDDMLPEAHAWFDTYNCRRQAMICADQLQRIAFQTIQGDDARASAYRQICFFDRVRRDFPNTPTARWIETHCDNKAQWVGK